VATFVGFDVEQVVALGRLLLAMLLGAVLGIERERAEKPAGLRTHMLVAGSAALLVSLGDVVIARSTGRSSPPACAPIRCAS
jgi:putative Mg2+ transporter-C (MgtC) family protein